MAIEGQEWINENNSSLGRLRRIPKSLDEAGIMPEQYYPTFSHWRGDHYLRLAVLNHAINEIGKELPGNKRSERFAREAMEWIERDEKEWPLSFMNICAVLGIEIEYLRRGIRAWRQRLRGTDASNRRPNWQIVRLSLEKTSNGIGKGKIT